MDASATAGVSAIAGAAAGVSATAGAAAGASATAGAAAGASATSSSDRAARKRRQRLRELERLDRLLDDILNSPQNPPLLSRLLDVEWPLVETGEPSAECLTWSKMASSCDPCRLECHASTAMAAGQPRGDRKREQVAAFAWILETVVLPRLAPMPTIVDCGCSTGSLLLPLAFCFPQARFVAIDTKAGSLARLRERADAAGSALSQRVDTWQGRIEEYDGPCDAVVALHACGAASDAALALASRYRAPFAVSPCCVGKLTFGTNGSQPRAAASEWLLRQLHTTVGAAAELGGAAKSFGLLAAWADSSSLALEGDAVRRQRRAKRVVELDRLAAMESAAQPPASESGVHGRCVHGQPLGGALGGGMLCISGAAMESTSSLTDILVGPIPIVLAALPAVLHQPLPDVLRATRSRSADGFERHVRNVHACGHRYTAPCVLDASPAIATHFAIGSLDLVRQDLLSVLDTPTAHAIIGALAASGVARAFEMRRELVNFKKACLLLLQDAERLERTMSRQASFFASEAVRCADADCHECPTCHRWRTSRLAELRFFQRTRDAESPADAPAGSPADAPASDETRRYLCILDSLHYLRGLRMAVLDMRMLLKALCLLPRHPDEAHRIPKSLLDIPSAFYAAAALRRAETDVAAATATSALGVTTETTAATDATAATAVSTVSTKVDVLTLEAAPAENLAVERHTLGLRAGQMEVGITTLIDNLPERVPPHIAHYVRQSLVARGAAKAVAQAEGARIIATALEELHARTAEAMAALRDVKMPDVPPVVDGLFAAHDRSLGAALSHTMKVSNHVRVLTGLHTANEPLLRSLQLVISVISESAESHVPSHRLFAASDASSKGHSAMCFPPAFAPLIQRLHECQDEAARNEEHVRAAMGDKGWPPPWWSLRQASLVTDGPVCRVCERRCPRLWQDRSVCWRCDEGERADGRCPYDVRSAKGRARAHPFCKHQSRCAACDAAFRSCTLCRLAHGDGEAVLAACEAWQPTTVFLDFDRTLCTTKSGADPLRGAQTVDAELQEVASRYPAHVLTRNRHTEQIRQFLAARGVPVVEIHSTPTRDSKATYMKQVLAVDEKAVFVDDDANELHDPLVEGDARIFRVLFERS